MALPEIQPQTFYIYGRKLYPQPLGYIDQIEVGDPARLKEIVFERVGRTGWVELVAFASSAAIRVIPREAEK